MPRSTSYGHGKGKPISQAQRANRKEGNLKTQKRKQKRRAKKTSHRRAKATGDRSSGTAAGGKNEERMCERERDVDFESGSDGDGDGDGDGDDEEEMHGALVFRLVGGVAMREQERDVDERERKSSGLADEVRERREFEEQRVTAESEDEDGGMEEDGDFGVLVLRGLKSRGE